MVLEYILHIRQSVGSMIFGGHHGSGVNTAYKTERGYSMIFGGHHGPGVYTAYKTERG